MIEFKLSILSPTFFTNSLKIWQVWKLVDVVSIGAFLASKVIFKPLENVPSVPPLSSYVIHVWMKTRQVYNLFQDLLNWFIIVEGS